MFFSKLPIKFWLQDSSSQNMLVAGNYIRHLTYFKFEKQSISKLTTTSFHLYKNLSNIIYNFKRLNCKRQPSNPLSCVLTSAALQHVDSYSKEEYDVTYFNHQKFFFIHKHPYYTVYIE